MTTSNSVSPYIIISVWSLMWISPLIIIYYKKHVYIPKNFENFSTGTLTEDEESTSTDNSSPMDYIHVKDDIINEYYFVSNPESLN